MGFPMQLDWDADSEQANAEMGLFLKSTLAVIRHSENRTSSTVTGYQSKITLNNLEQVLKTVRTRATEMLYLTAYTAMLEFRELLIVRFGRKEMN